MMNHSKEIPTTYTNKDGKPVDIATGKVLLTKKDGTVDMRHLNLPVASEKGLEASHTAQMSIYVGEAAGENWEKLFDTLTKNPMLITKAVASVGFTMRGFHQHLTQNKALQERFDLIQGSNLDDYEQNMHDIANLPINDDSKALPTILRANYTRLNESATSRGYGI